MRFLHLFKFGLVEGLAMSPEVRGRCETPSYFLFMLQALLLSTCLRSKPLLACGQRALRAYNDIGECLFVQARQPFANIAKLLCSFLCPLLLGAFALLLRSLVEEIGILFYLLLAMSHEDRRQLGRLPPNSLFLISKIFCLTLHY